MSRVLGDRYGGNRKMTTEIGGHKLEMSRSSSAYGSSTRYQCTNPGCYIDTGYMEFSAGDYAEELAKEYSCPSGTEQCIRCGHDITPDAEICKGCSLDARTGERIY